MAITLRDTEVVVGPVRFAYAHVFEPHAAVEGADKKYSVTLIIPKDNTALMAKVKAALEAACKVERARNNGKLSQKFRLPIKDGDKEYADKPEFANAYVLNTSSKNAPQILKPGASKGVFITITDERELYSGCYGYASINFFEYNSPANKGVTAGLNHLLLTKKGDYLGGKVSAEATFANADLPDDIFGSDLEGGASASEVTDDLPF